MNFKFSSLLGAPYRGGNILLRNDTQLFSSSGNRVTVTDLASSDTRTLPFETTANISRLALSPNGVLLIAVDEEGRAKVVNARRRVVLHHFSFKSPVTALQFSPDGKFFAAGVGRLLQIWHTPDLNRSVTPLRLHRSYSGGHDKIASVDWSPDSRWVVVANKDLAVRVFSLDPLKGYRPARLAGHKDTLVAAFFKSDSLLKTEALGVGLNAASASGASAAADGVSGSSVVMSDRTGAVAGAAAGSGGGSGKDGGDQGFGLYTVSRDGALFSWTFVPDPEALAAQPPHGVLQRASSAAGGAAVQATGGAGSAMQSMGVGGRLADGNGAAVDGAAGVGNSYGGKSRKRNRDPHPHPSDGEGVNGTAGEPCVRENGEQEGEEVSEEQKVAGRSDGEQRGKEGASQEAPVDRGEGEPSTSKPYLRLDKGRWQLQSKHFFMQPGAKLTACDYHRRLNLLVAGFSTGTFGLYQLPEFATLHLLSISNEKLSGVAFNESGDWVAVGCGRLGQLVVWEWRSESYVLKVQGHFYDVSCLAFSPDGLRLVTGASDCKVKLWNLSTGLCFVTLKEHTMPVTDVAFLPSGTAIVSCSLDGTVRAFDLQRYRNFRTMAGPTATQFAALAVHPSGEVVCAASQDDFQIYVWSMKTGRLLDVMGGHEGPVHCLAFSPMQEVLASGSWDGTVRLWDVFDGGKGSTETMRHNHNVLAVAFRPDSRQIACSTLDGQIHFWSTLTGDPEGMIEGRRDIAGGRLATDRRAAANSTVAGKCFNSLSYSADGSVLLAGGNSRFICLYDVADKILLRRYEITSNRSLDGVVDMLNSKRMTDAGPLDLLDAANSDDDGAGDDDDTLRQRRAPLPGQNLPGAVANRGRPVARCACVRYSPTGQAWAAATTDGVVLYELDEGLVFDPADLDIDATPQAVTAAIAAGQHSRALHMALRLNEPQSIGEAVQAVPPARLGVVAAAVPMQRLPTLINAVAELLDSSPNMELMLLWAKEILQQHGRRLMTPQGTKQRSAVRPAIRALLKVVTHLHDDLAASAGRTGFLLNCLTSAPVAEPAGAISD